MKSPLKMWLEPDDIPPLLPTLDRGSKSFENHRDAERKRQEVVNWLNFEIKKAWIEQKRLQAPERFRLLKKFATAIRTSYNKSLPEFWLNRIDVIPEDIYLEYVVSREQRKARNANAKARE